MKLVSKARGRSRIKKRSEKKMNISEAQSQNVFYFLNGNIVEESLYEYLREFGNGDDSSSVEENEVTTYHVDGREFERERDAVEHCEENEISVDEITERISTHYSHIVRYHPNYGRKIRSSEDFGEDQQAAETAYIKGLEWYVSEKNWDAPQYFDTLEEADQYRQYWAADAMGVDLEVFVSIEKKQKIVDEIREERSKAAYEAGIAADNVVFEKYKAIIPRVEPEVYKETEKRLAAELPEQINGRVFHRIVKHVRQNG